MCVIRQRAYPATAGAVSAARNFASAAMVAALEPQAWQVADDAALVVSELMTACIEADASGVDVRLDVHYNAVRIQVTAGYTRQSVPELAGARARILDTLTARAGREVSDESTRSVAYLSCDPRLTSTLACNHRPAAVNPTTSGT